MSKFLKRRARKAGLPPGILIPEAESIPSNVHVTLIEYSADTYIEKKETTIQESIKYLDTPQTTWIHVCGIDDPNIIDVLGRRFGLHSLLLEDVMTRGQRSKLDDYKDSLFIVAKILSYNDEKQEVMEEQVSFVLGNTYLISFLESNNPVFAPIQERLRAPNSRLRQRGPDYLCYTLLDCIVDNYFLILEKVDAKLEGLEEELTNTPSPKTLHKIQHYKREITLLRKAVWPMREVISNFRRIESPLIQDSTKLYLHDVYDHTIQAIDTIESFRDITGGMLDIYLSNISQKMNEVMKVLTVVATIFVPLTFLAGVYGMNFEFMPGLHSRYGFHFFLLMAFAVAGGMIYFFRRKNWI